MVHSTHLRSFCALFTSGFTTVVNWLLISWDANPFLRDVAVFFGVTPSDIWRKYGAVVVSKYWTKERNLNPRCCFFFWRDANKYLMKMWNFETYNMQSNSWKHGEKPPGTRMKWPMFPSIPHWQRTSKVHVWDEDPRLENGPLNVKQPGKSYEWLVDGGGQRAFHSLHPAGEKKQNLQYCVWSIWIIIHPSKSPSIINLFHHLES